MFTVYVLYSELHNKIYVGFTLNLEARLASHNAENGKGYTHSFKLWKVVHTELFTTNPEAMKREKQLKSAKGREFVLSLVELSPG
jgi:putative endonuclease